MESLRTTTKTMNPPKEKKKRSRSSSTKQRPTKKPKILKETKIEKQQEPVSESPRDKMKRLAKEMLESSPYQTLEGNNRLRGIIELNIRTPPKQATQHSCLKKIAEMMHSCGTTRELDPEVCCDGTNLIHPLVLPSHRNAFTQIIWHHSC
eukprot:TRINITY_DN27404_c0_g1_i1.p1 TRINITY_DN27404_c0_g1~~TRINITY_DN27404_c0_g1_i1.p1  ORF type:complete len:150 (+),score=22.00 TRINITY_DN27404_c0_g1_i1:54-503(+)